MAKPRLNQIIYPNFVWVNIVRPTNLETVQLKKHFNFHETDLKAVLPPIQRPRLDPRPDYLFMILLYPVYDRQTRKIHAVETDFFISQKYLVTAVSEEFSPLTDFFNHCRKSKKGCQYDNPAALLYEILNRLEQYCFPMSTHISNDVDQIENAVFSSTNDKATINEVLLIKINIVNFRKALHRHPRVLQNLANRISRNFPNFPRESFKELIENTDDLWGMMENYQDTIDAIHESHLSLLNYNSNRTMQIFTVFTTIIFTLELAVSLVSLFIDTIYGRWLESAIISLGLFAIAGIMVIFFRRQRWL